MTKRENELSKYEHTKDEFIISARAIIKNKNGQILAIYDHRRDTYNFAGGKIDKNESIEVGLKREVQEELNVNIKNPRFITAYKTLWAGGKTYLMLFETEIEGSPQIIEKNKFASLHRINAKLKNGNIDIQIDGVSSKKENGRHLRHCYDSVVFCYKDLVGDGKYPYIIPKINEVQEESLYYECFSLENKNYYNIVKSDYNNLDTVLFQQSGSDLIKGLNLINGV